MLPFILVQRFIYIGKVFWQKRLRFLAAILLPTCLAALGDATYVEMILFVLRHPRGSGQVGGRVAAHNRKCFCNKNFANVNTAFNVFMNSMKRHKLWHQDTS